MNRQKLKELVCETVKKVLDEGNPIYKDLKDGPEYWKRQATGPVVRWGHKRRNLGGGMRHRPQYSLGNAKDRNYSRYVPQNIE